MAILRCYFITRSAGPRACRKEPAACQDALVPRAILDKAVPWRTTYGMIHVRVANQTGLTSRRMRNRQEGSSMTTPDWAFEFHGHGCPFMPLGYRMGIRALRELEVAREQDHGLFVIPELGIGHPQTCLMDGLQIATGATYGKSLMERTYWGKLAAVFYHPEQGGSAPVLAAGVPRRVRYGRVLCLSKERDRTIPDPSGGHSSGS